MKQKIGFGTAACLIIVALLADVAQFLLTLTVIGSIAAVVVSIFVWTIFIIWFALLGVNYFDKNGAMRFLIVLGSFIPEIIPVINAIPAVTVGVIALIVQHNLSLVGNDTKKRLGLPTPANDNTRRQDTRREAA